MATVTLVGWKEGLQKVELTKVIRSHTGYGLTESKRCVDDLLEGKAVTIGGLTDETAQSLFIEASNLGAGCKIETTD